MEMHDLWKMAEQEDASIPEIRKITGRKSTDLLEKFIRHIKIENWVAVAAAVIILLVSLILDDLSLLLFFPIPVFSVLFGLVTIRVSRSIRYVNNLSSYLNASIKFLRYFMGSFLTSAQVVLGIFSFILISRKPDLDLNNIFSTEYGQRLLLVISIIELFMLFYLLVFYRPHLQALKNLRKEQDSN